MVHLRRVLAPLLLLWSVSAAEEDTDAVSYERDGAWLVVRSAPDRRNFLFRIPAVFERVAEAKPPALVQLEAHAKTDRAVVRLQMSRLGSADLGRDMGEMVGSSYKSYQQGYENPTEPQITGEDERRILTFTGLAGGIRQRRTVLLMRNGEDLYQLFMDAVPADSALDKQMRKMAEAFTVLDVKEPPVIKRTPKKGDFKKKTLSHDYYRIKLLKPEGFVAEAVDARSNPGLVFQFRGEDAEGNACIMRVRVHLAAPMKRQGMSAATFARQGLDRFTKKHKDVRGPKSLKKTSTMGAKEAYKFSLSGRHPRGNTPVREEWRVLEHPNGRIYEFQVTSYLGAARSFKKQISAFWRSLKIARK